MKVGSVLLQAGLLSASFTFLGCGGSPNSSTPAPTPASSADFTLTVTPGSQSVMTTGSTGGSQVTLSATALNGFTGTVTVTASGFPNGVNPLPTTLTLTPGSSEGVTFYPTASAMAGMSTVTFTGNSGTLTHTATLKVTVSASGPSTATGPDVTTYHYDNTRQGLNAQETYLTPATVNSNNFGLLGNYQVDGKVDAQPLYVGGLKLATGTLTHAVNVLYVATENDSVYAIDISTGAQEWKTSVLLPGEVPSDSRNCNQIVPTIGITSTPVIDRSYGPNGGIFVVGMSKDASGAYHHRLHALDLTTGLELPGSPTEIAATYPGNGVDSQGGNVVFDPGQYVSRPGMLLLNGTIYTGWGSHCDIAPYHGWVMGYNEQTLKQSTVLNLTPNGSDGAIWMSGYGLAADTGGSIYLLDANGTLDLGFTAASFPSQNDFGNAMLKLGTSNGLSVTDFFDTYNTIAESAADKDLGAGGAMLLPDLMDSTGAVHHLMVGAGKDMNIYVGNRDNLGKVNLSANNNSNVYQELQNALPNGAWSGPAYFNNTVYYAGVDDNLKAFSITNAMLSTTPTSESVTSFAYPGSTPSVSSNGTQSGIVWAAETATNAPAVLHAYNATNLANELYNSNQAPNGRDAFGVGNKYITPVVTNGYVIMGTSNSVAVFGMLP